MLRSALRAVSNNVDSTFLTAYWLPAFVLALGSIAILAAAVGLNQLESWVSALDSLQQTLGVALILLLITMVAFSFRALMSPLGALFAGDALPRSVAAWSTRGQLRVKHGMTSRKSRLLHVSSFPQ